MRRFRHAVLNERDLGGGLRVLSEGPLDLCHIIEVAKKCDPEKVPDLMTCFASLFLCFRSPSSMDLVAMQIMRKALQSEVLECRVEIIPTVPDVEQVLDSHHPIGGCTIESGEHKGMKRWLRKRFESKGILVASEEVSYLGYKVDVGSVADKLFAECGDTEPMKVFEFLRHGENMGILQYNAEDVTWFVSSVNFRSFAEKEWMKRIV